ncbi:Peptidase A1 domain-containing protein [Aphelenchoides besseyi]|nr:Peptidase A1 domain-containing protein [Aphelenchoides besseyi]
MNSNLLCILFAFFVFNIELSDCLVLRGQLQRHNAEKLRRYQRLRRENHVKKLYTPDYPQEPLTFDIYIGKDTSQSTPYRLSVETMETQMWTLAPNYPLLTKENHFYDHTKSKSSWAEGSWYGYTGEFLVSGWEYGDLVKFNNDTVFNQTFGCVSNAYGSVEPYNDPVFDGIDGALGLAWNVDFDNTPAYKSEPIRNILNYDKNVSRENHFYVLWVASNGKEQTNSSSGRHYDWQITFGHLDLVHCERNFKMTSLSAGEHSEPKFMMTKFTFGEYDYYMGSDSIIVDTGSPVIYMPKKVHSEVFYIISPDYDWDTGLYTVNCSYTDTYADWVFSLGQDDYKVPSTTYIMDVGLGDGRCILSLGISETEYSDSWVLGNPWLMEHCVLFSVKDNQIGFAKPKNLAPQI